MKKALLLCLLLFSTNAFAQINDGTYQIDMIIDAGKEYRITTTPQEYSYGNHVTFDSAAGTFHSYYTAPCGNDCFRSSQGRYEIVDDNHIRLHLLETSQHGDCPEVRDVLDLDLGAFRVQTDDNGITLTPE